MVFKYQKNRHRRGYKQRLATFLLCFLACNLFFSKALTTIANSVMYKYTPPPAININKDLNEGEFLNQDFVYEIPENDNPEGRKPENEVTDNANPKDEKPESTEPEGEKSENDVSDSADPEDERPESEVPGSADPEDERPESEVPGNADPEDERPESEIPDSTEPEDERPENEVPEIVDPEDGTPDNEVPIDEDSSGEGDSKEEPEENPDDSNSEEEIEDPEQEENIGIEEDPVSFLSEDELNSLKSYIQSLRNQSPVSALSDQEPIHRKYIQSETDGTYLLTLDVTGESTETQYPADVVIMFDVSSSTNPNMLDSFKHAARALADILLTKENDGLPPEQQTRIGIITFNQGAYIHCGFTSSKSELDNCIETIKVIPGYTNWAAPIALADQMLGQQYAGRSNVRKYALFQTDGAPNRPNSNSEYDSYNTAYKAAEQLVSNDVTLFSLAVLDHDNMKGSVFMPYVRLDAQHPLSNTKDYTFVYQNGFVLAPEAMTRNAYRNTGRETEESGKFFIADKDSENEYIEVFTQIAEEISLKFDFKDITITDTLSEYISLMNPVDEWGNILNCIVEKTDGVNTQPLDNYTLTFNSDTQTLKFSIPGRIDHNMTYKLTLQVRPSQTAYDILAENRSANLYLEQDGYPHIGGENTGSTSENQFGFYSNKEALLAYYIVDKDDIAGPERVTPYEMPVVQIQLGSIRIEKKWVNIPESVRPASITIILKRDDLEYRSLVLDAGNGWSGIFEHIPGGPDGHIYTLEERSGGDYEVSYSPAFIIYKGLQSQSFDFVVTNSQLKGDLVLLKTNQLDEGLEGASFKLYKANSDWSAGDEVTGYQLITDSNGICFLEELEFGDYILVEEKAPVGYTRRRDPIRIRFTQDFQVVTIVNYPSYELPSAGGFGVHNFNAAGGILILCAVCLMTKKIYKKIKNRKWV